MCPAATAITATLAKTSTKHNKRGFTLIELTVVITILAMFAAAIMPNLVSERRSRAVRQFFPEARNLLMETRSRSIGDGQARTIRYEDGSGRLIVERTDVETGDTSEERGITLPEGVTGSAFRIERTDSTSGEWRIGFYADGKSEGGGIEFDADGRTVSLLIDPSGSVRIIQESLPDVSQEEWDAGGYEQRI